LQAASAFRLKCFMPHRRHHETEGAHWAHTQMDSRCLCSTSCLC
jgi:hypothetical protein